MCCTWLAENTGRKNDAKNRHLGTTPQLCRAISSQLRHASTIRKNLLSSNISSTCPHTMVNSGVLAAEIVSGVWGTPTTFNGFCVLAALLHGSQVVSVSQTIRHWTERATYVRQGDHHVGHWPTFLVWWMHSRVPGGNTNPRWGQTTWTESTGKGCCYPQPPIIFTRWKKLSRLWHHSKGVESVSKDV